jgi:nucleolar protein TMA23
VLKFLYDHLSLNQDVLTLISALKLDTAWPVDIYPLLSSSTSMDAQAHLVSLGWLGPGHPLHPSAYKQKGHRGLAYDPTAAKTAFSQSTYPSNGLFKPLLVSQKQNNLGLGRRAHEPQAGNEWWLKGFEKALGDVGKSESERSSGVSTPVRASKNSGRFGALYTFFVRGGEIEGTIDESDHDVERADAKRGRKRKSGGLDQDPKNEFEDVAAFMAIRDKDEKRRRGRERQNVEEEFSAVEAFMHAKGSKRKKRKSGHDNVSSSSQAVLPASPRKKRESAQPDSVTESPLETKEERREQRRKRREQEVGGKISKVQVDDDLDDEASATKAFRKAEKKKRKAEKAARKSVG